MLLPLVVALSTAALPIGKHRGQLVLHYGWFEGGVAATHRSVYRLQLALEIRRDKTVALTVVGNGESRQSFRGSDAKTNTWTTNITWTGAGEASQLLLREGALEQSFRCRVSDERVATSVTRILRCDPITPRKGFPWNDRLPAYLRVPIVVAVSGDVRVEIDVDVPVGDEQASTPTPVRLSP